MKFKRAGALILSTVVLAGTFAGCGPNSSPSTASGTTSSPSQTAKLPDYMNPVGKYPITKEKITVNALVPLNSTEAKDWNTLLAFQRLEKMTNIHWNFEYVDSDKWIDQVNIRMASDELPEVITGGTDLTSTFEETYGPTGKILDLTNLIPTYMPYFAKRRSEVKDIKYANTSLNGKIYGLPNYTISSGNVPSLSFFDQKTMEKAGITSIPKTTDELYTMLKAFKKIDIDGNGKVDDIPMSCKGTDTLRQIIQPAFQGMTGGYISDEWDINDSGKVVWLPLQKGYKEYLEFMHKLYSEKLLDNEFQTMKSDQFSAKVKSGVVGLFAGFSPTGLAGTKMEKDPLVELAPLTSSTNNKQVAQQPNWMATTAAVLTKSCKHPEAVLSWSDLFYRKENESQENFNGKTSLLGYENENWKYMDSAKTKYQFIDPIKSYVELNKQVMITFGWPAYIDNSAMQAGGLMETKISQNKKNYEPHYREAYPLKYVRFTTEENDTVTTTQTDLDNYLNMMEGKFINGQESLNNFDQFVAKCKQLKVEDLTKTMQAAYDRYTKGGK